MIGFFVFPAFADFISSISFLLSSVIPLVSDRLCLELNIWNNFSNYDTTKGRLFTWMLNLTRNLTIDTLRSKGYKKQSKISSDENSVSNYADNNATVERFDAIGIRKQLSNLKPEQRSIIDMFSIFIACVFIIFN